MTDPEPARPRVAAIALAFYAAAVVVAVGIAWATGTLGTLLGEREPDAKGMALGAALGIGVVVLCRIGDAWSPAVRRAGDVLADTLGPVSTGAAVALALASAVGEEVLFRGAIQPHLGLAWTAVIFGAVHVVPARALAFYPVFALAGGLLFGWLRESTGSVVPSIVTHAVVNGLNIEWLVRRLRRREPAA